MMERTRRPRGLDLGKAITRARVSRGLRPSDLAKRLGLPQPIIWRWEKSYEGAQPSLDSLKRIASALEMGLEDLIELSDPAVIPDLPPSAASAEDRFLICWRQLREAAIASGDVAVLKALRDFSLAWIGVAQHEVKP